MTLVSQILQAKGGPTWTIAPDAIVFDALSLMAEKNIGALVVVENDVVIGIFSERDYSRKIILEGKSSRNTKVQDIMTDEVLCVRPDQSVTKCMALMTDKHVRHIPVLDNGRLVGVISIGDVVKAIINEQQIMINHLEDYIYS
jgi:CBS domain-containing protein